MPWILKWSKWIEYMTLKKLKLLEYIHIVFIHNINYQLWKLKKNILMGYFKIWIRFNNYRTVGDKSSYIHNQHFLMPKMCVRTIVPDCTSQLYSKPLNTFFDKMDYFCHCDFIIILCDVFLAMLIIRKKNIISSSYYIAQISYDFPACF